jgi:hypothetical protein
MVMASLYYTICLYYMLIFLVLQVGNGSLRSISSLDRLDELAMVCCSCIDDEGLELLSKGSDSLQVITSWDVKLL